MMSKQNLVRKQYLMSTDNISRIEQLAQKSGTSSAQIVRLAVDAYDPDNQISLQEEKELMELVSTRLKETISETRDTRKKLDETLTKIGAH